MRDGPVLMTGASGFIGSWIIPKLVTAGRKVIATDLAADDTRLKLVTRGEPLGGVTWAALDVTDKTAIDTLVAEHRPTDIIHLAALMIPACKANPVAGAMVDVIGHLNMLEAARTTGARLVYTSSIAAKPRGPDNAVVTLYGVYKKTDEEMSRLYARDFGVPSLGLRPNIVYGVGRDLGETSCVSLAAKAAALGGSYALPWHTRAGFQLGDDIAEMFVRAANAEFEGAHVSDMSKTLASMTAIVDAIKAAAPGADITIDGPERSSVSSFETHVLEMIIGALPETPVEEGIARTITHFRELRKHGLI